jgi:hypothetical protein
MYVWYVNILSPSQPPHTQTHTRTQETETSSLATPLRGVGGSFSLPGERGATTAKREAVTSGTKKKILLKSISIATFNVQTSGL